MQGEIRERMVGDFICTGTKHRRPGSERRGVAQCTTNGVEQIGPVTGRVGLWSGRRWCREAHEYGEVHSIGERALPRFVADPVGVLGQRVEYAAVHPSTLVGEYFIGHTLLDVVRFAGE